MRLSPEGGAARGWEKHHGSEIGKVGEIDDLGQDLCDRVKLSGTGVSLRKPGKKSPNEKKRTGVKDWKGVVGGTTTGIS